MASQWPLEQCPITLLNYPPNWEAFVWMSSASFGKTLVCPLLHVGVGTRVSCVL